MIDRTAPGPFLSDHLIVGSGASFTDAQWARTEPLSPDRTPRRGGRWRDHRDVIDAIAFKCRTGTPWMDLPERFGSWRAAHNRLRMWALDGTWEKVFTVLLAQADAEGDLGRVVAVDSTIVRAHQHAAGARQKGLRTASRATMPSDAPRRADHEDPPRRRRALQAARLPPHARPGRRRARIRGGHGCHEALPGVGRRWPHLRGLLRHSETPARH
ncbi:IS5 family transposase [Kitasatospora griseola]|uniref:IS5 family transposase n=1 Tax=Kitasatospora griseola TaxID=2064 RepID=UPI003855B843